MCRDLALRAFTQRHAEALAAACSHAFVLGRSKPSLSATHFIHVRLSQLGAADALRLDRIYEVGEIGLSRREDGDLGAFDPPVAKQDVAVDSLAPGHLVVLDDVDPRGEVLTICAEVPIDEEDEHAQARLVILPEDRWADLLRDRLRLPTSVEAYRRTRIAITLSNNPTPCVLLDDTKLMRPGPDELLPCKR